MASREKILGALNNAATAPKVPLPEMMKFNSPSPQDVENFAETLRAIGGTVVFGKTLATVKEYIFQNYPQGARIVSGISTVGEAPLSSEPQSYENVDLAILRGEFGVAENGAVWLKDENIVLRVLPYICQHLIMVVCKSDIVPDLHYAYDRVGDASYGLGTFIAGPSKTADIEQSLVLGAHGPRTMVLFILDEIV